MNDKRPTCPQCGAPLKPFGRGASRRKHGQRWECAEAVAEMQRTGDREHRWLWTPAGIAHYQPGRDAWDDTTPRATLPASPQCTMSSNTGNPGPPF